MAIAALAAWTLVACPARAGEVGLAKRGGVYTVPVKINGALTLDFVVDSGAAEVSVPADVVLTLVRTRTVSEADFLPGATYRLADGSHVQSPRFILRTVQVGNRTIRNVPASIGELTSQLLLGQSVLERLGHWSMDTRRGVLAFADGDDDSASLIAPAPPDASKDSAARAQVPPVASVPAAATGLTPVETVRRYYALINAGQYWDAWNAMSEEYRASVHNDFAGWIAGFRTTRSVAVTSAVAGGAADDLATVVFSLQSSDELDHGATVTKMFQGTWRLSRTDGRWLLAKPSIREIK